MSLNPPITAWQGRSVWLIGASSGIGAACARRLHAHGARVAVSARSASGLQALAQTHPGMQTAALDVTQPDSMAAAWAALGYTQQPPELVVYCAGWYQPLRATQLDTGVMLQHLRVNYEGAVHCLSVVLPALLQQSKGHISLVSSVAGFRGLPNALAYGPSKAALTHLAEALYLDVHALGLGVSVVHPGFVETPLTAQNHFHMPALVSPETAAKAMMDGWEHGDFDIHFPKRFTRWLQWARCLPYPWYFPLVRRVTGEPRATRPAHPGDPSAPPP
jgi:NAD(P)-dependent dehydrogenase (short-subunit alcohol dehydrogenase family)